MADTFERPGYAQRCEIGLKRPHNEDSFGAHVPSADKDERALGSLFVVADGIGSIGGGEQASHWAVKTLIDTYYDAELEDDEPRERILAAIQDAQDAVRARARILKVDSLGTTVVGAVILPSGRSLIFNVGDSRAYHLHGGSFEQVTSDQVYIDPKGDPKRAKLTSYLGQPQPILPNIYERQLTPGDKVLLCSDGLWGLVEKDEIAKVVTSHDAKPAVDLLVERVYERGARDNVTICIVETGKRRGVNPLIWAALLVLAGLLAAFLFIQNQPQSAQVSPSQTPTPAATTLATALPTDEQPTAGVAIHRDPTATPTRSSRDAATATPDVGSTLVVRTPTPGG
jgi:protein phosphatase